MHAVLFGNIRNVSQGFNPDENCRRESAKKKFVKDAERLDMIDYLKNSDNWMVRSWRIQIFFCTLVEDGYKRLHSLIRSRHFLNKKDAHTKLYRRSHFSIAADNREIRGFFWYFALHVVHYTDIYAEEIEWHLILCRRSYRLRVKRHWIF